MISDMPLPMPRSVICSPSHMMNAVPVVSVSIVIRMNPMPGLMTNSGLALKRDGDARRLNRGQHDRQISRVGRDLAAPEFAFLGKLFQVRPHHRQQLQDDRRRDVRHDAQREDRSAGGSFLRKTDRGSRRRSLSSASKNCSQRLGIDAGRRDVRADAVNRQQPSMKRMRFRRSGMLKIF